MQYLVYRHGSNAANQPMTPKMAVAVIEASSWLEALNIARAEVQLYANQSVSVVSELQLIANDVEHWSELQERIVMQSL